MDLMNLNPSEKVFFEENFFEGDEVLMLLQNYKIAFECYVNYYNICDTFATNVEDGEVINDLACNYAIERLTIAHNFCKHFKRLLTDVPDCCIIDLNGTYESDDFKLEGFRVVSDPVLAKSRGLELVKLFSKSADYTSYEIGALALFLADK